MHFIIHFALNITNLTKTVKSMDIFILSIHPTLPRASEAWTLSAAAAAAFAFFSFPFSCSFLLHVLRVLYIN